MTEVLYKYRANQWTSFYMIGISVIKKLKVIVSLYVNPIRAEILICLDTFQSSAAFATEYQQALK